MYADRLRHLLERRRLQPQRLPRHTSSPPWLERKADPLRRAVMDAECSCREAEAARHAAPPDQAAAALVAAKAAQQRLADARGELEFWRVDIRRRAGVANAELATASALLVEATRRLTAAQRAQKVGAGPADPPRPRAIGLPLAGRS